MGVPDLVVRADVPPRIWPEWGVSPRESPTCGPEFRWCAQIPIDFHEVLWQTIGIGRGATHDPGVRPSSKMAGFIQARPLPKTEDRPAAGPLRALARAEDALRRLTLAAIEARLSPHFSDAQAREETARIAKSILADARSGLRILDLTVTIAPLLGLLGTVLGMIAAFQALQAGGVGAEASTLAGGIWQALLTTAAGMAVAIPASVVLTWFESLIEALQNRMEDLATRVFVASIPA